MNSPRPKEIPFCLRGFLFFAAIFMASELSWGQKPTAPDFESELLPILKDRCCRCHGPNQQESKLNLAHAPGLARGSKAGPIVDPGRLETSRLWSVVSTNQMPKDEEPLTDRQKETIRRWIEAQAPGLPKDVPQQPDGDEHWAFQRIRSAAIPTPADRARVRTPLDAFVQAKLESQGLTLGPDASRFALIRRVSLDLTGLPPTVQEIESFIHDRSPTAYEDMVERYLASPLYGERWGRYWLDAAGYADSNGYFNADTDRPSAYRYRDYVVRSINADKPFDEFLREQLAGDEMANYRVGMDLDPRAIELLTATHFLRNSPDGTDSSDGNEDEVRTDKYAVLEGTLQIMGSSLFGMTIQCARCHNHKFEPFSQADYYGLQAILFPAFNVDRWTKTKDREIFAASAREISEYQKKLKEIENQLARIDKERRDWLLAHPEPSKTVFADDFNAPDSKLSANWSNTAPGDDDTLGKPPVAIDSDRAPAVKIKDGVLRIIESGTPGDRAISTRQAFDWTPKKQGDWIQATFDLVEGAPYVGFFIALNDYNDKIVGRKGNVLLDGAAGGQAKVYVDYPGPDSKQPGAIGKSGYKAGHNYGVRITNVGKGKFELSQLVDGVLEPNRLKLTGSDLPKGGFGFALCCGRSFAVDNVRISQSLQEDELKESDLVARELRSKALAEFENRSKDVSEKRPQPLPKIAIASDLSSKPPEVFLLQRGVHKNRSARVQPAAPHALVESTNSGQFSESKFQLPSSTGARLAFANWLTKPDTRASARLARVTVNRWWSHHFGTGIVPTCDNLGYSGAAPAFPDLLEYLANRLIQSGWSQKAIHRLILHSTIYRQSSRSTPQAQQYDPSNRLLSRFPLRRLDADAIRDSMLAASGELDSHMTGPYIPTQREADGEVTVKEDRPGGFRRSLYLQQRRTQVPGFLESFDAPSIVFNSVCRTNTTVPLQSLTLLNSKFARNRAQAFATRLLRSESMSLDDKLAQAFLLAWGRSPTLAENEAAKTFLETQTREYAAFPDAYSRAWTDLANMLLAANAFLYVE